MVLFPRASDFSKDIFAHFLAAWPWTPRGAMATLWCRTPIPPVTWLQIVGGWRSEGETHEVCHSQSCKVEPDGNFGCYMVWFLMCLPISEQLHGGGPKEEAGPSNKCLGWGLLRSRCREWSVDLQLIDFLRDIRHTSTHSNRELKALGGRKGLAGDETRLRRRDVILFVVVVVVVATVHIWCGDFPHFWKSWFDFATGSDWLP